MGCGSTALWLLALSSPSLAAPGATKHVVQLIYQAPEGCPPEHDFRQRVESRLSGQSLDSPQQQPLVVRVELRPESSLALVSFEDEKETIERRLTGDSCEELATAAAVIAAVTLTARADAPERVLPAEAGAGAQTSTPASAEPTESAPAPVGGPAREPIGARAAVSATRGRAASEPPASLAWEAGLGAFVATWPLSSASPGADVFLRTSANGWSARASAQYLRASTSVGGRSANFSLFGGRLEGCPRSTSIGKLRFELCLVLEAGALNGQGDASSALLRAASATVPWLALAAPGRVRLALGSVVNLEAQGEIALPLTRPTFAFERPRTEIAGAPVVGFSGRLGAGFTFL